MLGSVSPDRLGVTMVHEHVLLDLTCLCVEPESADERALARQSITLENLAWVRRNWNSSFDSRRRGAGLANHDLYPIENWRLQPWQNPWYSDVPTSNTAKTAWKMAGPT